MIRRMIRGCVEGAGPLKRRAPRRRRSIRLSTPLTEDSIHIVTEPSGRPAGIAFVEFGSADEARQVVGLRNRKMMGSRYVELFPSSRDEATRVATGASNW